MAETITIVQTAAFSRTVKKLHANQKAELDLAVHELEGNPALGELMKGDLADVRVYKFRMINQLALLAYTCEDAKLVLTLLAPGSHENFYRSPK